MAPPFAALPPPVTHGLRLAAAVSLALLIAFWLQLDNAYWAATSASIVAQPRLGASLRKTRFRTIGTVIGGIAAVLITAALAMICAFFASILPNFASYAAALTGYTTIIVFSSIVEDPSNVLLVAVWRTTEIGSASSAPPRRTRSRTSVTRASASRWLSVRPRGTSLRGFSNIGRTQ